MQLKRIIAGIATFALAITAAATPFISTLPLPTVTQQASAATYGDYRYNVLDDGTVEITAFYGTDAQVTIPSEIDGKKVTSIGDDAFYRCSSLTSIAIPDSVTSIGGCAFKFCSSLTNITIPDNVTNIEYWAFEGCTSLTSVTIPNSVTSIDFGAFSGCTSLTDVYYTGTKAQWGEIIIDDGNVYLTETMIHCSDGDIRFKYDIFDDGTVEITDYYGNDTVLVIPSEIDGKKVTSIGSWAFDRCTSLTSITIPGSVTSIGNSAFSNCKSLTSITIPDSVTSIGNSAFFNCESLTSITIPDSVTSIGNSAFFNCESLTSITIPDSVTSIENLAFCGCSSLISITIPNSVTSIGDWAFSECSSLTDINVSKDNKNYCSVDGVLFNKDKTEIVCYPAGKSDKSYAVPDSVTSIGDSAFSDCSSLTSITIPDSVTSIGDYAFYECSSLTSINISKDNKNYCSVDGVLFNKGKTDIICYPAGKSDKSYAIPDSVTSIGDYAFFECSSLESITIPNSVTSIGYGAFEYCTNLTSITIPDSVTSIGSDAFSWCTSLTNIIIPDSVTSIGGWAFYDCTSLTDVYYTGTEEQWDDIYIEDNNDYFLRYVSIHYNYDPAHTHTFGEWKAVKAATCTTDGIKERTCECGKTETETIKAIGHTAVTDKEVAATCTKDGKTAGSHCSKCGATIKAQTTVKATGHKYTTKVVAPTTSAQGYTLHTCSVCGSSYKDNYKDKLTVKVSAVTGLKLKGRANNALRIAWNKNTSADGYIVEMYKGGKWVRAAKITANSTTEFKKSGLAAGTAYKFRVKAYKMSGKTALYSGYTEISARTNPSNVMGLKTLGRAKSAVRFGWTKNTSADGYIVEMYKNGKWVRAAKITSNATVQFKKTGLKANTTYKFRVKAYKMSGSTALYSGYTNFNISTTK